MRKNVDAHLRDAAGTRSRLSGLEDGPSGNGNGADDQGGAGGDSPAVAELPVPKKGRPGFGRPAATARVAVRIPPILSTRIMVVVKGTRPYVMNTFSVKAGEDIKAKQVETGEAPKKRAKRDPKAEYEASLHRMPDGKHYGVPAAAFKKAMVTVASQLDVPSILARTCFSVEGDTLPLEDGKGKPIGKPTMREDWVRTQGWPKQIMPRWRGEVMPGWVVKVPICIKDMSVFTIPSVIGLMKHAGLKCGIGEGRPEKTGAMEWGLFEVVEWYGIDENNKRLKEPKQLKDGV